MLSSRNAQKQAKERPLPPSMHHSNTFPLNYRHDITPTRANQMQFPIIPISIFAYGWFSVGSPPTLLATLVAGPTVVVQ
jgi:hypothetical protein